MNSSEDKGVGIKGWLSGKVPKAKPQEPTTRKVVLDKHRIAILPFVNMSPDPNDEYFADGITEEIISTVSGISGLDVISRTSVMGYRGTTKKVEEIGTELKAGSILEGSFRKAGNRIRVTTQLIDVAVDKHLWAQNYDRNLDDIFAVQSDVAKQVAEALRVRILSSEKRHIERKPTESTAAYTLYLMGRSLWNKRGIRSAGASIQDIKKAMEYFEFSVREDPGFALGYVGQADCAIYFRDWLIDREENLAKAKAMLERALQLDPALAEAHATLGFVHWDEFDLRGAEEELRRAIELKPSYATAHRSYYYVLRSELRWDEALEQIEKAAELDPLSGVIINSFGWYYLAKRDWQGAVEKFKIAIQLGFEGSHGPGLFCAYGMMKMYDQMEKELEAAERYYQVGPRTRTATNMNRAHLKGDKDTVRKLLPELEAHPKEAFFHATDIAGLHFFLGDVDKGFEWLEQAYSKREDELLDIQWQWDFDGIRDDPRYLDLLKRIGLYQTAQSTS